MVEKRTPVPVGEAVRNLMGFGVHGYPHQALTSLVPFLL
jgi:hypothetical protein